MIFPTTFSYNLIFFPFFWPFFSVPPLCTHLVSSLRLTVLHMPSLSCPRSRRPSWRPGEVCQLQLSHSALAGTGASLYSLAWPIQLPGHWDHSAYPVPEHSLTAALFGRKYSRIAQTALPLASPCLPRRHGHRYRNEHHHRLCL